MSSTTLTAAETKEQILWVAKEMLRTNLEQGTAGNLGARLPDGNAVLTPSSLDYTEMTLDDLVVCDLDGNVLEGTRGPTSEKALHLTALREHDNIGATMHCHAKFATMFALTRTPIPAVIEEFDVFVGGDLKHAVRRCVDDRPSGSHVLVAKPRYDLGARGRDVAERGRDAGRAERVEEQRQIADHLNWPSRVISGRHIDGSTARLLSRRNRRAKCLG